MIVVEAKSADHYAAGRGLFEEYARELGVDLCFQDFAFELEHVHEIYAPPTGCLLLGRSTETTASTTTSDTKWIACVGVRRLSSEVCEMKRLYVREADRSSGMGRHLTQAAVAAARARGYRTIVLDTLASMKTARQLYSSLGFRETGPYYANPLPDVVYMSRRL